MAKLYAEVTKHDGGRVTKCGDNTRIMVGAYHKNKFLGSFEMYQVDENDTVNVLWRPHGKGSGGEVILVNDSQLT